MIYKFLTVKQWQDKELEIILDEITLREHGRSMSLELCREAFENYRKYKQENKTANIITNDYLALRLTAYLASFGMYRGSTILLKYFDYTIQIGAVEILLKPKYDLLFGFNPFNETANLTLFYDLFKDVYKELFEYYKNKVTTAKKSIIERYNKVGYPVPKNLPNATPTLITKILLGVYGCCPAYDTFAKSALEDLGINIYKNNVPDIEDLINKVNSKPSLKKQMTTRLTKLQAINPLYTPMRVLDIILWSMGKGIAVYKKISVSPTSKTTI